MSALRFREVLPADLPELMDLWVESWSEVYAEIDFEARRGWFINHMNQWIAEGGMRIAAFDPQTGSMDGFILHKVTTGHLDQFCVRAALKGKGVSNALMIEVKRLSPKGAHLSVNALNTRAIRFYERHGFVRVGDGINPHSGLPIFHYRWQP
jgi:putative acetyltransferase